MLPLGTLAPGSCVGCALCGTTWGVPVGCGIAASSSHQEHLAWDGGAQWRGSEETWICICHRSVSHGFHGLEMSKGHLARKW
jgi:hypothetical protein